MKKLEEMNLVDGLTAVKCDGEAGAAYMKSFERKQRIRAEGKADDIGCFVSPAEAETLSLEEERNAEQA